MTCHTVVSKTRISLTFKATHLQWSRQYGTHTFTTDHSATRMRPR